MIVQLVRSSSHLRPSSCADNDDRTRLLLCCFCCCRQVYDNCRMLSTTGELLCFCDMRKLTWYVERGLAERVLREPPTIRLLFEHKNSDQQVRREH